MSATKEYYHDLIERQSRLFNVTDMKKQVKYTRITAKQKAFIRQNMHLSFTEIATAMQLDENKVMGFIYRNKLKPSPFAYFTAQEDELIKTNYTHLAWKEIGDLIGRPSDSIRHRARILKLKRTDAQKIEIMNRTSKPTQYQHGNVPYNTRHDGETSYRTDKNGNTYKYIRISKSNWQMAQIVNWEKVNGPLPEGNVLRCINGNQIDCTASNWEPISKAEHIDRNLHGRKNLEDGYIISLLARGDETLKPVLAEKPELIELKRNQLKLKRAINEHID